jgi:hypothetical protein
VATSVYSIHRGYFYYCGEYLIVDTHKVGNRPEPGLRFFFKSKSGLRPIKYIFFGLAWPGPAKSLA